MVLKVQEEEEGHVEREITSVINFFFFFKTKSSPLSMLYDSPFCTIRHLVNQVTRYTRCIAWQTLT